MTDYSVRFNYDRFVNTGLIPGTDYENSVLDDIVEWADATFDDSFEVSLPDLIDLYWMSVLHGVQYEKIVTDEESENDHADIPEEIPV